MNKDINFNILEKEFGLEDSSESKKEIRNEIRDMKERLKNLESYEDPDEILKLNIERANYFLDKIEEDVVNGSVTGIMMQAASSLISEITNASNSLATRGLQFDDQDLKHQQIEIKRQEVEIKRIIAETKRDALEQEKKHPIQQNNLLVMSRKDVLKIMSDADKEELGETIDITTEDEEEENLSE